MLKNTLAAECFYALILLTAIVLFPFLTVFSVIRAIYRYLKSREPEKCIKDQIALITGSGRGLGRLTAIELAKRGCHLAIADIQGELAEETANYIAELYKVKTKAYKIDVTNYEQLEDLKTKITNDLGDVTILINNAGIITHSSFDKPTAQEVHRMINVNFNSVVYVTQIFLPKMKELNRGHIVNVASLSALMPTNLGTIYGATKAAVRHMTSSLRIELLQQGCNITATTIMPTFLNTNPGLANLMDYIFGKTFDLYIDGGIVVHHLVKAMLNGDDEVTVPRVVICYYKLIELLPAYVREKLMSLYTKRSMTKATSDQATHMLTLCD